MNVHDFSIQLLTHSLQKWLQIFPLPNINLPHLSNVLLVFYTCRGPDPAPRLVYASFDYMGDELYILAAKFALLTNAICNLSIWYLHTFLTLQSQGATRSCCASIHLHATVYEKVTAVIGVSTNFPARSGFSSDLIMF